MEFRGAIAVVCRGWPAPAVMRRDSVAPVIPSRQRLPSTAPVCGLDGSRHSTRLHAVNLVPGIAMTQTAALSFLSPHTPRPTPLSLWSLSAVPPVLSGRLGASIRADPHDAGRPDPATKADLPITTTKTAEDAAANVTVQDCPQCCVWPAIKQDIRSDPGYLFLLISFHFLQHLRI